MSRWAFQRPDPQAIGTTSAVLAAAGHDSEAADPDVCSTPLAKIRTLIGTFRFWLVTKPGRGGVNRRAPERGPLDVGRGRGRRRWRGWRRWRGRVAEAVAVAVAVAVVQRR